MFLGNSEDMFHENLTRFMAVGGSPHIMLKTLRMNK